MTIPFVYLSNLTNTIVSHELAHPKYWIIEFSELGDYGRGNYSKVMVF